MRCSRSSWSRPARRRSGHVGNTMLQGQRTALGLPSSSGAVEVVAEIERA